MAIKKTDARGGLSTEELAAQHAEQLPDREQMSLVNAFLARRADGQVLQLPRLLYLVAANSDGSRSYGQIAEAVTKEFGRGVSADNVQTLVDSKLRPLGVLTARDGSSLKLERPNPLLAL